MAKREGQLLTASQHLGVMQEIREGFVLARRAINDALPEYGVNLHSHEVFLGLLVLGSIGAGITDKIKPPRTDSDTDISPVISGVLPEDIQHEMARAFFSYLNHYVYGLDRYFQPTSSSEIGLAWTLSDVYRSHNGVSLLAKKNSDLQFMAQRVSEKNRIQLHLIEI